MASGLERIIALTLNLIAGVTGLSVSNIPAIITDEALSVGHAFGAGVAKKYTLNEIASGLVTDFGDDGETYDAAMALAEVTPRVNSFYVIKRATAVAGVSTLEFSEVLVTGNVVAGTVNGHAIEVTFATDNAATLTALAAAIQALDEVATAVSDGTDTITITFTAQVDPAIGTFAVTGGADQPDVTLTATTPAVNIATDIAAAIAETATNLWFMLLPTTTNRYAIEAAAAYVESLGGQKMALFHTTDAAVITSATTDVASALSDNAYNYSGIFYHDDSTEMIHARLASRCLAVAPGQVSFALKSLTGATSAGLTAAQIGYAEGKNANTYTDAGPGPLTLKGVNVSGVSLEAIRDSLYAKAELESALYNLFVTRNKLPYDEQGRQLVLTNANAVVSRLIAEGVFDPDFDNAFTMPEISAISADDKAARLFPDCRLTAKHLAGAIKIEIQADISVA